MHIIQMIDNLRIGGAQRLLSVFAAEATRRGIFTSVVSISGDAMEPIPEQLRAAGAEVVLLNQKKLFSPDRWGALVSFLEQHPASVVQTHLTYANIVGVLAARRVGVPVVATLHSTGQEAYYRNAARNGLESLSLRWGAQQVIAVGQTVADTHRARVGSAKLAVVPNAVSAPPAVPEEQRAALRHELLGGLNGPLILAVGRLSQLKGYLDLIEAFSSLAVRRPQLRLVIAGEGRLREEMETKIAQAGLQNQICLLGGRGDVAQLMAASDLMVNASHWEGLPLAVLEAMMAGLPVVVTAVGDLPWVVRPDMGMLTQPADPRELADVLVEVLDHLPEARQKALYAQSVVRREYAPSLWFDRLLEVYARAGAKIEPEGEKA